MVKRRTVTKPSGKLTSTTRRGSKKASFEAFKKKSNKMFNAAKERAEAEGSGLVGLEDGHYIARLSFAEISKSQSSGRMQIKFSWLVVDGEAKGDSHNEYQGINSEDNITYLNKRLMRLGYDAVGSFEELEETITELNEDKPGVRLQVSTRGDFTNVYIKKVLDEEELPDDDDDVDDDTDDTKDTDETSKKRKRKRRKEAKK